MKSRGRVGSYEGDILGSYGDEYEDGCFLSCCTV